MKQNFIIHFLLIAFLGGLCFLSFRYSKNLSEKKSEEIEKNNSLTLEIASLIASDAVNGDNELCIKKIRNFSHNGIIYAELKNKSGEIAGDFTNADVEMKGFDGGNFKDIINSRPQKFYDLIDTVKVKFFKKSENNKEYFGEIKIAFLLPFRFFERILIQRIKEIYIVLGFLGFCVLIDFFLGIRRRRQVPKITGNIVKEEVIEISTPVGSVDDQSGKESKKDDITISMNQETGADLLGMVIDRSYRLETKEYSDSDIDKAEGWIPVFNGWDIDDWEKDGSWYVSNNVIIGSPWNASLVRTDVESANFEFKFKARKIVGRDGFIAIFKIGDKSHAWVIGGWGNKKSEVMRIKETVTPHRIERAQWYEVRVTVLGDIAEGFLNDTKIWSVNRRVLDEHEGQKEFLNGFGFATWNTLCKFKDATFLKR